MTSQNAHLPSVAIHIDKVSKSFIHQVKGSVFAAQDVSLAVKPGEFLTLLGPSGCGKTTTLRMVAGFGLPDTGRILFGEQDVTRLAPAARNIGFVFQNYALFPHLSIFENVAYGLRVRGHADASIQQAVSAVLAQVGLSGYERQFSSQLSGGEQQRVALARAIVIQPQVLLFDEPLSNLDARLRVQMRQEIRALQQRLGISTLYVTHDQEEAMAVSDRIAVMNQGKLVQLGTAQQLYHEPVNEFVARFVGKVNLVAATVTSSNTASVLGQTCAVRFLPASLRVGSAAIAVLRPEAIGLSLADTNQMNDGSGGPVGTLKSCTFLGEKLDLEIDCAGTLLQVALPSSTALSLEVGTRLQLRLPEAPLTLLESE